MVRYEVLQKSTVIFFHQSSEPDDSSCPPQYPMGITHGSLGQALTVLQLVQIRLCLRRDSGEYFPHPRLVPCGLHNVEAPAEAGFHVDGKGGLEGLVG